MRPQPQPVLSALKARSAATASPTSKQRERSELRQSAAMALRQSTLDARARATAGSDGALARGQRPKRSEGGPTKPARAEEGWRSRANHNHNQCR